MNKLSKSNWKHVAQQATTHVASLLKHCIFVTHSNDDSFTVLFGLRSSDGKGHRLDDESFCGRVSIRYWRRFRDYLDELLKDKEHYFPCPGSYELLYGPNGTFAFQVEWRMLQIVAHGESSGVFLDRNTRRRFKRDVQMAILEEAHMNGCVDKEGTNGPFLYFDGRQIPL
jgi:hypothetical protein